MATEEVVLLLNFNGTNDSTTFVEETGKTITAYGDVKISTDQSVFSGSSGYFDGTGDFISFNTQGETWDFSNKDWTLECWVYLKDTTARTLFAPRNGTYFPFGFYTSNSNHLYAYASAGSGWIVGITGTSTIPINTWTHIAFVRYGNLFISFINGVIDGTAVYSGDLMTFPSTSSIGTDSGGYNSDFYGYIDSFRLIKGRALYTEDFTVPTEQFQYDSYYDDVSLLLPFDGPNNSTVFGDYSPNRNIITPYGNAKISTTQSKFGGSSGYFDGSGDYLSIPSHTSLELGTNDFTIECYIYPQTYVGTPTIYSRQDSALALQFRINTSGYLQGIFRETSSTAVIALTSSNTISLNQWSHVALTRKNGIAYIFINGVYEGQIAVSYSLNSPANEHGVIGALQYSGSGILQPYIGYVDEFRLTNGIARYITDFTPPTQTLYKPYNYDPFLDKVSLLLHFDGDNNSTAFKDSSVNNVLTTAFGNASISTIQSKYGGSSGYFDGTGDYLEISHNDILYLNSDFTIEFWVYSLAWSSINSILSKRLTDNEYVVTITSGGLNYSIWNSSNTYTNIISTGSLSLNTWYHIAITKSGTTYRAFIDGVLSQTTINSTLHAEKNVPLQIGGHSEYTNRYHNGYIDDLRITKGVARYTADFTPPAYRFYDLVAQIKYFYGVYNDFIRCAPGETIGDYRDHSRIYIDNDLYFDMVDYGEINIQGYYKIDKTPVYRKIRLCTYPNHLIIRETWSDPITGLYSFNNVKKQDYVLIFEDYENLHHSKIRRLFMDQL